MILVRPAGFELELEPPASPGKMGAGLTVIEPATRRRFEVFKGDVIKVNKKTGPRLTRPGCLMSTTPRSAYEVNRETILGMVHDAVETGAWRYLVSAEDAVVVVDPAGLCTTFVEPDMATLGCCRAASGGSKSLESESGSLFLRIYHRRLWLMSEPGKKEQYVRHADAYAAAFMAMHHRFSMGHIAGDEPCVISRKGGPAWWNLLDLALSTDPHWFDDVAPEGPIRTTSSEALRLLELSAWPEWDATDPPLSIAAPWKKTLSQLKVGYVAYE